VNSLTLTGSTLRPRPASEKGVIAVELLTHVWPLLDSGEIRPHIDTVFELGDAMAAHELMESSVHMGKIVLRVGRD
jgi:NADPH2:quinone reductase